MREKSSEESLNMKGSALDLFRILEFVVSSKLRKISASKTCAKANFVSKRDESRF